MHEIINCEYCGEIVWKGNFEGSYPNGFAMFCEQALNDHYDSCSKYPKEKWICPDCGEVLAEPDPSYLYNNPNGADMWYDQLLAQHRVECSVWQEENVVCEAIYEGVLNFGNGNIKPFKLVRDYYSSYGNMYYQVRVEFGKGGTGVVEKAYCNSIALRDNIVAMWNKAVVQLCMDEDFQENVDYDVAKQFYDALCYEVFHCEKCVYNIDMETIKGIHLVKKIVGFDYKIVEGIGSLFWFYSNGENIRDIIMKEERKRLS